MLLFSDTATEIHVFVGGLAPHQRRGLHAQRLRPPSPAVCVPVCVFAFGSRRPAAGDRMQEASKRKRRPSRRLRWRSRARPATGPARQHSQKSCMAHSHWPRPPIRLRGSQAPDAQAVRDATSIDTRISESAQLLAVHHFNCSSSHAPQRRIKSFCRTGSLGEWPATG
jgi:hypothetical protein